MVTVTESPQDVQQHNAQKVEQIIKELKATTIPGVNARERVYYLIQRYPYLQAKHMGEILGISTDAVYTAKYGLKKAGIIDASSIVDGRKNNKRQPPKSEVPKNVVEEPIVLPFDDDPVEQIVLSPEDKEQQMDIWDSEPAIAYSYAQTTIQVEPAPVQHQPYVQPQYVQPPQPQYAQTTIQVEPVQQQQYVQPQYVQPPQPQYVQPPYAPPQPPYTQLPYLQQAPPAPYGQPMHLPMHATTNFGINVEGVDGVTVRSLMNVAYGKVIDNRRYRVNIQIEEI